MPTSSPQGSRTSAAFSTAAVSVAMTNLINRASLDAYANVVNTLAGPCERTAAGRQHDQEIAARQPPIMPDFMCTVASVRSSSRPASERRRYCRWRREREGEESR